MTELYPIPSQAAYIWLNGDIINLGLPAAHGERGHTVSLPTNEAGLKVLLNILQERQAASSRERRLIGTDASPIQHELMKQIAAAHSRLDNENAEKRAMTQAERDAADVLLREIGL